jgi:hypothetical protein
MGETSIPLGTGTRENLKWAKLLLGARSYDEAINLLIEEAGLEVPDEELSPESVRELVRVEAG